MANLSTLIERVEALTGPDREVDAEVMFDLLATPVGQHKEDGGPMGYIRLDDQPSWNFGLRFPGKDRAWFQAARKQIKGETLLIERDGAYVLMNSLRIPEITASIDAAVALVARVLPGWRIENLCEWDHEVLRARGPWMCDLVMRGKSFADQLSAKCANAPTPAIALVLAALRAKAQEGRDG